MSPVSLRYEVVDLVGEAIELALRYVALDDSRLVARQLAPTSGCCAHSPITCCGGEYRAALPICRDTTASLAAARRSANGA